MDNTPPLFDAINKITASTSQITPESFFSGSEGFVRVVLNYIAPYSYTISAIAIAGIVWCVYRITQILKAEKEILDAQVAEIERADARPAANEKWMRIEGHLKSDNPNDWRQAILEADVLLEEMLTILGYRGETLGEKLKNIGRADMQSIDAAWEAHRVRNRIAHEGADYDLSEREAKRVIALYRAVFEEFQYI